MWPKGFQKSKVKGIFQLFSFNSSPKKMPVAFQNSSRYIQLESLVRFGYQITEFWISCDEIEKFGTFS